jgi:type VI secretion system protein ImpK
MADSDDPFGRSDATVLRPRPGAGRRGDSGPVPRPPVPPPAPAAPVYADAVPPPAREILGTGLNPLVQAASPLLLLAGQFRGTLTAPDIAGLRRHAIDEIRRFEERARSSGIPNEVVLAARYALCAGLDEAVLSTPWGAHSEWAQQTLLVALHREAWGGEKFFEMLDRISQDPGRHIDLMELQYLCLAFGFAGKYQVSQQGHARLAEVQNALYRTIRAHRGVPRQELALKWRGVEDRRNPLIRYVPWWVVGAGVFGIVAVAFTVFYVWLQGVAAPVKAQLTTVGVEDFTAAVPPAPTSGPTLKELLADAEARRLVSVDVEGGRTTITPLAPNLFASGSARIDDGQRDTMRQIAEALRQVPGRVLVKGHTDDQPIHSLRFRDNFDLSRARAVSVVDALAQIVGDASRLESIGVGSNEPKFRPESEPGNRARNRRVEIIHVQGA